MSVTVFDAGSPVTLADRDLLGVGGEGRVYARGDRAYKLYFKPTAARAAKLRAFPRGLPATVIAPERTCEDGRGRVIGYVMRRVAGAIDFHKATQRAFRFGVMSNAALLDVLRELSETLTALHGAGVVLGDLNDGNVVLTPSGAAGAHRPHLIDADSMQLAGHPCVVAHERYLDPRLYGVDLDRHVALTRESDFYALAVLAFSSLLYVHPFGGAHPTLRSMLRRAEARHSVLRADVTMPRVAAPLAVLPDDALEWFRRVFEGDLRAPLPRALLEARFQACSCGVEHARRACPGCSTAAPVKAPTQARGALSVTTVARVSGASIVDASFDGALRYLVRRGNGYQREDGRTLDLGAHPRWLKVTGATTWVGDAGRVSRFDGASMRGATLVSTANGELAADATVAGLVYADGEWLVRESDGTRIGQILEGQTHVRVGDAMGLAFYRAGELTIWLSFDPRAGALRQLDLPPIHGKIVDFSVAFDGPLALFTALVTRAGRLEVTVHLVDATGRLLASDTGPVGARALLHGVHGRVLAHGAIVTATPDGLALSRLDAARRTFEQVRVFPDTAGVASPESRLLVGRGGSLYAVDHDEIRHLTFHTQGDPSP